MTTLCRLLVAVAVGGATGCAPRPSERECRDLLDRYTVLLLRAQEPRMPADELDHRRGQAQLRLGARPELARCGDRVSRRAYQCAMRATSSDDIERCLL